MNLLIISGNLGQDAEIKEANGKKFLSFSVAVKVGIGDTQTTLWVSCTKWGEKTAVVDYLKKGTQVCVAGECNLRTWEKDGKHGASLQLRVDKLDLLGSKQQGNTTTQRSDSLPASNPDLQPVDDLPF